MIFQALIEYYDRLAKDSRVPPFGFSQEGIGFSITINPRGEIVGEPRDLRHKVASGKYEYYTSEVPYRNEVNVRSSGAAKVANFMVDKADYIFGMSGNSKREVHHQSFRELVDKVCGDSKDPGVRAVKAFLSNWKIEDSSKLPYWKELSSPNGKWIAFELEGERGFIHERPEVKSLWKKYLEKEIHKYPEGISFVSGVQTRIQTQFAQFKFGSGASLVSFNESAYESYGKKRGWNAPIDVLEEFKASTALKQLINSKNQRIYLADTTVVFWTERDSPVETFMGMILDPREDFYRDNKELQVFLEAAQKGTLPHKLSFEGDVKFYVLGFSVNKARLAIRFWYVCTVDELRVNIGAHFRDLEMERERQTDPKYPGIWHLLKETAVESNKIHPLLAGSLLRSVLAGHKYPLNLYQGVFSRVRADRKIRYLRAAIIKAVLTRNFNMEVPMSLNTNKKDISYLLGRLFAILEKTQYDALGQVNTSIKDRFFSSACAAPASVFPILLRLGQYHIEKSDYGNVSDKRIAEVMDMIDEFPAHLNLKEQGLFALGYYHQKNALWRKQPKDDGGENE